MVTVKVYGADWCSMTRDTLAYLEEQGVPHEYIDVDDDPEASEWVKKVNHGKELKPTLDIAGVILSTPSNEEVDAALKKAEKH